MSSSLKQTKQESLDPEDVVEDTIDGVDIYMNKYTNIQKHKVKTNL